MTAKKSNTKTKKAPSAQDLMGAYMEYVLHHGEEPKSVYKFAKDNDLDEQAFYAQFGSFTGLRKQIWIAFFENTMSVLHKNKEYNSYRNQEKMLSFFFTFFEVLTANRSYVLFVKEHSQGKMKGLDQLKGLRTRVKAFAADLIEDANDEKANRLAKNPVGLFSEGAWVQLALLMNYWANDDSPGFEKTDLAIEKSVKAIFDLFETTPLESILDLGKFIFKENFAKA
ncbi:TetR family transcriptional regulator C-terminal domain-containing protein [Croceiramulus getboli]|nr:TetR family transcriptional regulator C-terminal domain-containing protein [Flavobacteriaceae bacterium YJPT1-3]